MTFDAFAFAEQSARETFPVKDGPRPCCAEFAIVVECDGTTDEWMCSACERRWTAPCGDPPTEIG